MVYTKHKFQNRYLKTLSHQDPILFFKGSFFPDSWLKQTVEHNSLDSAAASLTSLIKLKTMLFHICKANTSSTLDFD